MLSRNRALNRPVGLKLFSRLAYALRGKFFFYQSRRQVSRSAYIAHEIANLSAALDLAVADPDNVRIDIIKRAVAKLPRLANCVRLDLDPRDIDSD